MIAIKRPVDRGYVTSIFGDARADHIHQGIDIAAPKGTPVKALSDGIVAATYLSGDLDRYGNTIVVKHNAETYTLYAHLDQMLVSKGQKIAAGTPIATVGDTAGTRDNPAATGAVHLHFETLTRWPPTEKHSDRRDPLKILAALGLIRGTTIPNGATPLAPTTTKGSATIAALLFLVALGSMFLTSRQ